MTPVTTTSTPKPEQNNAENQPSTSAQMAIIRVSSSNSEQIPSFATIRRQAQALSATASKFEQRLLAWQQASASTLPSSTPLTEPASEPEPILMSCKHSLSPAQVVAQQPDLYPACSRQYTVKEAVWGNHYFDIVNTSEYAEVCRKIKGINIDLCDARCHFAGIQQRIDDIRLNINVYPKLFKQNILELCDISEANLKEYSYFSPYILTCYKQGSADISKITRDRFQLGHICKIEALSLINEYYFKGTDKFIPMFKLGKYKNSIRAIAKSHGSMQGEVLDRETFENIASDCHIKTEIQPFTCYRQFRDILVSNLKANKFSFVCYQFGTQGGPKYIPDLDDWHRGGNEHAGIITDYDPMSDTFKMLYEKECGSKSYYINGYQLYLSNQSLLNQRKCEYYKRNPNIHIHTQRRDESSNHYKYEIAQHWENDNIRTPAGKGLGFRGVIISCSKQE